ncbi:MAG: carbon-phosphorus lyase complex subunit PhnI, partial [Bacteroidaceae bacterium]|nr:carbon-phosphorus lyase complex subunit PhnI [Bacteroidaceae bacterium]
MYKLLVLDLDGTLTNSKKEIPEQNLNTLLHAQEKGLRIVLASGRPTYGITPLAEQLQLERFGGYILSFNGGQIIDCQTNKVIYETVLDPAHYDYLYEQGNTEDFKIISYEDNYIVGEDIENEYIKYEAFLNKMPLKKVENFRKHFNCPLPKCLVVGEPTKLAELEKKMHEKLNDVMSVYRSEPFFLELLPLGIDKAYESITVSGENMHIRRRISSAFKDIPGGQLLGPTYDYVHRLLNFHLQEETEEDLEQAKAEYIRKFQINSENEMVELSDKAPRVLDILREEGLLAQRGVDNSEPCDITMEKLPIPAPRSAILQTLTRADTGFISGLAYSDIRGFGASHPTIGELRYGSLEIEVVYPLDEDEVWYVGDIYVTEVEGLMGERPDKSGIDVGYGCVFGRNDTKAIAMCILDRALTLEGNSYTSDKEFVLMHGDCLEMNGFISHLKL